MTGFYPQDKLSLPGSGAHPGQGTDFRFIPFPALAAAGQGAEEVAGDLLGMFRDTTAARELIAYLTTPQAQEARTGRPGSGAISVNRLLPLGHYPDLASRHLAATPPPPTTARLAAPASTPQHLPNPPP